MVKYGNLKPCSSKMSRILNATSKSFNHVIVLTDTEIYSIEEIINNLKTRHKPYSNNIYIIPIKPCLENWPCSVLGLKNCEESPCSEGLVKSLNDYWRRIHNVSYRKKHLPQVFKEAFQETISIKDLLKASSSLK